MARSPKPEPPSRKTCTGPCGRTLKLEAFHKDSRRFDGRRARCAECESRAGEDEAPPPKLTAAEERRANTRQHAAALRSGEPLDHGARGWQTERGIQLRKQGEQRADKRLSDADALGRNFLREAEALLARHSGKITATGRARRAPTRVGEQTGILFLSDTHVGSNLSRRENPIPFGPKEESRCLASILQRVLDFDPKRRDDTEILLLLGGDLIEGAIGHSTSAAEIAKQISVAWEYFERILAHLAAEFPRVRVAFTSGNHERIISVHPHRASDGRWNSYGTLFYRGLQLAAKDLKNVEFEETCRGYTLTKVYGSLLYLIHGDEGQYGAPETKIGANLDRLARLFNSNYLAEILPQKPDVVMMGHWHSGVWVPGFPHFFVNGALCPASPWAKGQGYVSRPRGQWFVVSRPGEPVAEAQFLGVGREQDRDAALNDLIPVSRYDAEAA